MNYFSLKILISHHYYLYLFFLINKMKALYILRIILHMIAISHNNLLQILLILFYILELYRYRF
jgi:hypothetical protein